MALVHYEVVAGSAGLAPVAARSRVVLRGSSAPALASRNDAAAPPLTRAAPAEHAGASVQVCDPKTCDNAQVPGGTDGHSSAGSRPARMDLQGYVRRVVTQAPALTDEQRAVIRGAFGSTAKP